MKARVALDWSSITPQQIASFWMKVASGRGASTCWTWTGGHNPQGYGRFTLGGRDGRRVLAHVFAYEHFHGSIPVDLELDHWVCDNPACVNPSHLRPTTRRENTLRSNYSKGAINRSKTHCPAGHPYDEGVVNNRGQRICYPCKREASKRAYRRKKAMT